MKEIRNKCNFLHFHDPIYSQRTNERKKENPPPSIQNASISRDIRSVANHSEQTRGEERKKWPQPSTDRSTSFSRRGKKRFEKNEESNRYKLGIRWLGAFSPSFESTEGGACAGSRKNSRKPRLSARFAAKVFTGKQWEIIRTTGGESCLARNFLSLGGRARSHLLFFSPLFLSNIYFLLSFSVSHFWERERERSSSAPCLSFLISNKRGMFHLLSRHDRNYNIARKRK